MIKEFKHFLASEMAEDVILVEGESRLTFRAIVNGRRKLGQVDHRPLIDFHFELQALATDLKNLKRQDTIIIRGKPYDVVDFVVDAFGFIRIWSVEL